MSCKNCKKLRHELDVSRRSSSVAPERDDIAGDKSREAVTASEQERNSALSAAADLITAGLELAASARNVSVDDSNSLSRLNGKVTFFDRFVQDVMAKAGISQPNLVGQDYVAGLKVEAVNIGDFNVGDELVIDEVIKPMLLFKSENEAHARLIQLGRVTVKLRG